MPAKSKTKTAKNNTGNTGLRHTRQHAPLPPCRRNKKMGKHWRCVQDSNAGRGDVGRRCRDVPAGASDVSTGRRMHLQRTDALNLRGPAGAFPQKNLRAPTLCIPSFNKRLCAAPAYVHFEKQRTHLVGTSLHPPAGRQPLSGISRQRQKPRCVQDSDVGTYRQVRPTCQPTGGCIYKERMP